MDTAGVASMNLPINYYYENQHMTKELGGDQDEHSVINWLMTLNYKKILQMRWMTESIGKAKLWMSDCGQSDDDDDDDDDDCDDDEN